MAKIFNVFFIIFLLSVSAGISITRAAFVDSGSSNSRAESIDGFDNDAPFFSVVGISQSLYLSESFGSEFIRDTRIQQLHFTDVDISVEIEPQTLVNDVPSGVPFIVVTDPPTANLPIPVYVYRGSSADGEPLEFTRTFNSIRILQNGVINNELVTGDDGIAQGTLIGGYSGQGEVEIFFDTDGPFSIAITNSINYCCQNSETGAPHSGELILTETDMNHQQNSVFRISRTYNSQSTHRRGIANGDIGVDWAFSFISDYLVQDGGNVVIYRSTNRTDMFTATSDPDRFIAPVEFYEELRQTPAGTFELRSADGAVKTYAAFNDPRIPGRLIRQEDKNGNFMSFLYQQLQGTAKYVLTTAVDTMGRNIQFHYYPADDPNLGRRGRLWETKDFWREDSAEGRIYEYDYNSAGDLISVRTPVITGTPTGNDFPNGKTTRYLYRTKANLPAGVSGYAQARLLHNLIAVEYPNETATDLDPSNPQTLGTALTLNVNQPVAFS
jgi:uncharacterized protein DUF6531